MQPNSSERTQRIRKVLIVHSDPTVQNVFVKLLDQQSCMPIIATSAENGFEKVAEERPSAVIVQQKLGDLDGDVFASAVKEEHRIPVLVVKSDTLTALMDEFNFDKLSTRIRELVNGPV